MDDAKIADGLARPLSRGGATNNLVSGTLVRMTGDEDADRRGPAKHAPASSQTALSSGWRTSAMMEQEGLKGKRVQITAVSTA